MDQILSVTCTGPVNIAVLKYWGKRDEDLILPINSSISTTLNQKDLKTTTTIFASKSFDRDRLWLNGVEESVDKGRFYNCFKNMREHAQDKYDDKGNLIVKKEEWNEYKFYIYSTNNFPTAAGLASSASGFACLVFTFSKLLNFKERFEGELTTLARLGSGSACRSLYGGFVKWNMGVKDDGSDSIGIQIADENHWDDIVILILVVSGKKKDIGSTSGMYHSVKTSELLKYRAEVIVPRREKEFEIAIKEKNFQMFGELMMKDSNQFHSTCLDTYPPIFYLNDISKAIIQSITKYNDFHKKIVASYTFDAGPNAVIYTTKDQSDDLKRFLRYYFPVKSDGNQVSDNSISDELKDFMKMDPYEDSIERIIETNIGPGPQIVTEDSHADVDAFRKWKEQYIPK